MPVGHAECLLSWFMDTSSKEICQRSQKVPKSSVSTELLTYFKSDEEVSLSGKPWTKVPLNKD